MFTSQLHFLCCFQGIGIKHCRRDKGVLKIVYLLTVWNRIGRLNSNTRKLSNFTRLEYENLSSLRKENSIMSFKDIGKMGQLLACAEFWVLCAINSGVILAWEMRTENWYFSASAHIASSNSETEGRPYYYPIIIENCLIYLGLHIWWAFGNSRLAHFN